jgi:GH18 family chitinase
MRHLVVVLLLSLLVVPGSALAAARSLTLGNSGADVTALQNNLVSLHYLASGSNTGYFGALTQAALEKFQCDKTILCSGTLADGFGVYGPHTQAAVQIALAPIQPTTMSNLSLTGPATGAFEFSGWLPGWRAASSTADVLAHLSQLNGIMPFGYGVSANGTITNAHHLDQEPWTSLIATAKAEKVRVIPTVMWGSGTQEQAVLSDTTQRIALEDAIANLVKQNGYDGIDIDFEVKQSQTINYFSTFLQGLYSRMGSKWVYCTVEARMPLEDRYGPGMTIPADATQYANDYASMNKYCDRVEIMAYDQGTVDVKLNAARSAPYAPVADPLWVAALVDVAAQSIAKNKIIVGIPTYGYEYTITPVALDPGRAGGQAGGLPAQAGSEQYTMLWPFNPAYATQIASQLGITPTRTSADEAGFTYNPSALAAAAPAGGNSTETQQASVGTSVAQNQGSQVGGAQPFNFVTWSDASAIGDKITLAHQLGVRGVAFFSLGGAEDPGMWNLLK